MAKQREALIPGRQASCVSLGIVAVWFAILFSLQATQPARAWNTSHANERAGCFPTAYDVDEAKRTNRGAKYAINPHSYILEHAIDILRKDGCPNWADIVAANRHDLESGATHADVYLGRVAAYFELTFLGFQVDRWFLHDLGPRGGYDHYFDPTTGNGLNTPLEDPALFLGDAFGQAVINGLVLATTAGILGGDIYVEPNVLGQHFYPGAQFCQNNFDNAVKAYWGPSPWKGMTDLSAAMYYLGWSCHLLDDLSVSQHVHADFLLQSIDNHSAYEDTGDSYPDHGNIGETASLHATSASGYYHHDEQSPANGWTAYRFAHDLAQDTLNDGLMWQQARSDDEATRRLAVARALPLAEKRTAALLARFMTEVRIPPVVPPLVFHVADEQGRGLPQAYLFWAADGSKVIDVVRTDDSGGCSLSLPGGRGYRLRPGMPGYLWQGKWHRIGPAYEMQPESTSNDWLHQSLPSGPTYQSGSGMDIAFRLVPLPAAPAAVVGSAGKLLKLPHPASSKVRAALPSVARQVPATRSLFTAGAQLPKLHVAMSQELADNINQGLINLSPDRYKMDADDAATTSVRLYRLVDLTRGELVSSKAGIQNAIESALALVGNNKRAPLDVLAILAERSRRGQGPVVSAQTDQAVREACQRLPHQYVRMGASTTGQTAPDGRGTPLLQAPALPGTGSPSPSSPGNGRVVAFTAFPDGGTGVWRPDALPNVGLLSIPSAGGGQVEVATVPGYGYIDSPSSTIRITTNSDGVAAWTTYPGNLPGMMRVRCTVVQNQEGADLLPESASESLVLPSINGTDPTPDQIRPPVFTPLYVASAKPFLFLDLKQGLAEGSWATTKAVEPASAPFVNVSYGAVTDTGINCAHLQGGNCIVVPHRPQFDPGHGLAISLWMRSDAARGTASQAPGTASTTQPTIAKLLIAPRVSRRVGAPSTAGRKVNVLQASAPVLVSHGDGASGGYRLSIVGDQVCFSVAGVGTVQGGQLEPFGWHYIAASYDGQSLRLHVDRGLWAVAHASQPVQTTPLPSGENLVIGGTGPGPKLGGFTGWVTYVSIYDGGLTTERAEQEWEMLRGLLQPVANVPHPQLSPAGWTAPWDPYINPADPALNPWDRVSNPAARRLGGPSPIGGQVPGSSPVRPALQKPLGPAGALPKLPVAAPHK